MLPSVAFDIFSSTGKPFFDLLIWFLNSAFAATKTFEIKWDCLVNLLKWCIMSFLKVMQVKCNYMGSGLTFQIIHSATWIFVTPEWLFWLPVSGVSPYAVIKTLQIFNLEGVERGQTPSDLSSPFIMRILAEINKPFS